MEIAILVFDRLTILDAVGPYEVLSRVPGARVTLVAERAEPVRSDAGLTLVPGATFAQAESPDVLVVPGGMGVDALLQNPAVLDYIRSTHRTSKWTTAVCTGSLLLGAAGLLRGIKATTHWLQHERLREYDAEPVAERVVREGKLITSAGVSAGIDMALTLAALLRNDIVAQAIQLSMEYDPAPPFDAGSPAKAPAQVVELVRAAAAKARERSS